MIGIRCLKFSTQGLSLIRLPTAMHSLKMLCVINHLESPELSPNKSSLSTRLRLELRLVWSVQEDGDRIRSIFCSMVWFMEEAAVLPLGALIVKTPSELIVEVTRSA